MAQRWIVAVAAVVFAVIGPAVSGQSTAGQDGDTVAVRYEATVADVNATMLIDPAKALPKAVAAEHLAATITDQKARGIAIAKAQWLQGESYLRTNDTDKADAPIRSALAAVKTFQPQSKLHADLLISMGWLDSSQGRAGSALIDYQRAFAIYRRLGDARGQSRTLVFIAMLYTEAKDPDTADRYYQQALEIYHADANIAVSIYNNRALVLAQDKQYKKAAVQFKKSLDLATQLNSKNLLELIHMNIARVQLALGNLTIADRAIASGRAIADPADTRLAGRLTATAAQSALQHGDVPRAQRLIESAFAGINPTTTDTAYRDAHLTAYDIFTAAGDSPAALVHLQALKRLDDAGTKLATDTKTALMAARFDFANQELRISQLKASELQRSIAFERTQARTQRNIFIATGAAVAVVIALLAIGLVTIRRSRDQVRAANDDLAVTNSALSKALAAKTEFLATTSHEIRTPLNGILGMTQVMLADPTLPADLRDRLGVVHGAGITMRALVNDILDIAKMETGNLTIEAAAFDVCATVKDAARMWEEQARAKGLSFTVDVGGCPAMIMGDAARVRQIVFNLLSNALKFTKTGHVALSIQVGDDDRLRVGVTDSGIGIPADKIEEIFESFRQADAGTTRQFGGTGLGLSICRNLARAMGGDVSVSSIVGQGATFTLVLPLVRADSKVVDIVETDTRPGTLIVDRNPITRSMFKTLLAPHGGPIAFAASVDEAVTRLADGDIARVLIDDASVRASDDALGGLSRIAEAAYISRAETTLLWPVAAEEERKELLGTGITRVVAKPVSGGTLIARMFDGSVSTNGVNPDLVSHAA
ncbi:tetratricopeptide repeat protein [Sphingomonas sp. PAMC26645]|uniref:tetratricopeptide repeat-containing sensor histidine kinase n=1 Tax=Sphingomonas sp. PAMC26645 TaxID=2565555 RepID=UPI00109E0AD2|nr:ATP-binding protein [Sphingomonas sp. PAMC26645]QCB42521.1 tetratricopeptide repeat protein [Sphingomonas sp. PAMC26645]